ncbi:MAG TPA: zf-HC2 domain-containing protein [Terriglobia bacterium]|nr:zf-HC2 domain-containing protein [Terriglobia bacterium]
MRVQTTISCEAAHELMSPFIDSMVGVDEANSLRSHLFDCKSCRRQLQSFISLRTVVASAEPSKVPDDLQLETRIRLSHARLPNHRDRWRARFDNILRPFAVPAVMGVALTLLAFGVLLASLTEPNTVVADDGHGVFLAGIYQGPSTPDATLRRLGVSPNLDDALSVQSELNTIGQIDEYKVIAGERSPGVDQWLQELVLLSQFKPATHWGLPVRSRIILSFVTVRG